MASYKSQHPLSKRVEDRAPITRLPQRSITPTAATSQLSVSSQSKLQKRKPSRDDEAQHRGPVSQAGSSSTFSLRHRTTSRSTPMFPQHTSASSLKPTSQTSTSRLPKLEVPQSIRTPSLASGSSASTIESPRSNVLRRKQTSVGVTTGRQAVRIRDDSMSSQDDTQPMEGIPGGYKDPFSETVLGISLPPSSTILACSEVQVESYSNPLYDDEIGPTDVLPLPAPHYALSATPSTRYSESPGPFSVSSTPTSMSSYSPAATLSRASNRTRQTSPLQSRPPITRHKTPDETNNRHPHALSTVRESSTSSSSTSTVVTESAKNKERPSPNALATLPQSPRTSDVIPSKIEKPQAQAPPEFAHLADQSPVPMPSTRRPSRPSRDGAPELSGLRGPSPIIQSNMPHFPSHHKRSASSESRIALASTLRSKTTTPAKQPSRLPSPNPSSALPPPTRSASRGPTPDLQLDRKTRRTSSGPGPTTAPSPSKTSRFGFFTRRTKTEPVVPTKSDGKLHRRGPAAGTGHEGYGRYAVRGRSGSSISSNSIGRSASAGTTTESLDKTPSTRKSSMTSTTSGEMDDFFLNRLAPVVIRGTGSSTELSRSPEPMQSTSSLDVSMKQTTRTNKTEGSTSQSAIEKNQPILLPSAMPDNMRGVSPMKKMTMGLRRPSESDDDAKKSSLPGGLSSGSRMAGRIRKNSISEAASEIKEGSWLKSSKKNKAEKEASKPSKRWNFFQRAHAGPRADTPAGPAASPSNKTTTSRSVAHYALIDQSGLGLDDIEQLMKEADEGTESALSDDEPGRKERMLSMLLPPKPILEPSLVPMVRPVSPKVFLHPEAAPSQPEQQRQYQQSKLVIDTNVQVPYQSEHYSPADLTPVTDLSRSSSPFSESFPAQVHEFTPSPKAAIPLQNPEPGPGPEPESEPINPAPCQATYVLPQDIPSPGPPPANPPPRPSRLAQVGRIPQVVSTRRQPARPSSRSFSRPFAANQPRPTALPRTSFDSIGSVVATAGPVEPYPILQGLSALSHGSAIATISPEEDETNRRSEFFKFPSRKDSEVSYSSSSGVWSFAPAASTAVVPGPGAPLSEDELWNEYDDLIDEVLSPGTTHTTHTTHTTEPRSSLRSHPSLEPMPLRPKAPINVPGSEHDDDDEVTNPSLHLRRSRLLAVLHSNQSPTSSVSFSEFISDYGERKISVIDPVTGRLSLPASPRLSTGSTTKRSTRSSLPASLSQSARQSRGTVASKSSKDRDSAATNRYRDSRLMDIAESQTDGLLSMANLRFGALMISKWLSFGRVLFSPVHFELKNPKEDRVLVIDGLGKDWSYYCALTYPEATVYDMGPDPSSTTPSEGTAEAWSTLGNHRHICHPSLSKAFPFPMHFFACVVLRFPTALPSSEHHFVLSEAKRVLRPGGYLEFSVLDMDLVNMGNRARRAIRGLKMRMQVADENISLRNISDEVMAGIGRKGFVECNRCVVGVPVAGKLPGLDDLKATSTLRKDSTMSSTGKMTDTTAPTSQLKPGFSFSELLNASSSESTNNDITDMVARVGRWWYSRCYESLVLPEAGEPGAATSGTMLETSIWRDESLIQECEKRGTSFKLLIGYAQKPEMGVRRTVSV